MKFSIDGIPIRGNKYQGLKKWKNAIIEQTKHIEKINYPCCVEIEFILQENQHPTDRPHGPDLDNLLKPFLDTLQKTILEDDSLIFRITASKRIRHPSEKFGAIVVVEKLNKTNWNKLYDIRYCSR